MMWYFNGLMTIMYQYRRKRGMSDDSRRIDRTIKADAEGELADKVVFEKDPDGNGGIVRIFKALDVEFVGRGLLESEE